MECTYSRNALCERIDANATEGPASLTCCYAICGSGRKLQSSVITLQRESAMKDVCRCPVSLLLYFLSSLRLRQPAPKANAPQGAPRPRSSKALRRWI